MSFDFGKWGSATSDSKLQIKARNPPDFLMEFKSDIASLPQDLAALVTESATSGKALKIKGDKDTLNDFLRKLVRKTQAVAPPSRKEEPRKEGAKKEESRGAGREAEGLKFGVAVKESASEVLLRDGMQEEGSMKVAGEIAVNNPSEAHDIWDVEVTIADKDKTGLESDKVKMLRVTAKESFKQEYTVSAEVKELPLTVKEIASTLGDLNHEAYYIRPGKEPTVAFKITIKNTSDKKANKVTVSKEFHANFESLKASRPSEGKADFDGQKLTWTIESLEAGAEAGLEVQGQLRSKEAQEPVPSGDVVLGYELDGTFTGLKVPSAVATTSGVGGLSYVEIDETPDNYQIKGFVKNSSDFAVKLGEFSAYPSGQKDTPDTTLPEGKELMLGPNETWESEGWNREFKEGLPTLAHSWRIQALAAITVASAITSTLKSFNFGISDIKATVQYSIDKLPSLRETPFTSQITAENIASAPLDTVILEEKVQSGFIPPLPSEVEATWNGEKLPADAYVVEVLDSDGNVIASSAAPAEGEAAEEPEKVKEKLRDASKKGTRVRVKMENLRNTAREAFKPNDKLEATFPLIADKPTAGVEYKSDVSTFANTYPAGEPAEFRPDVLPTIQVSKLTRGYRRGKDIVATSATSTYLVKLEFVNRGATTYTNVKIRDLIPAHFSLSQTPEGAELKEEDQGQVLEWVKETVGPGETWEVSYEMVGDGEHNPSDAQVLIE